jgi:hypothetical protein
MDEDARVGPDRLFLGKDEPHRLDPPAGRPQRHAGQRAQRPRRDEGARHLGPPVAGAQQDAGRGQEHQVGAGAHEAAGDEDGHPARLGRQDLPLDGDERAQAAVEGPERIARAEGGDIAPAGGGLDPGAGDEETAGEGGIGRDRAGGDGIGEVTGRVQERGRFSGQTGFGFRLWRAAPPTGPGNSRISPFFRHRRDNVAAVSRRPAQSPQRPGDPPWIARAFGPA